MALAHTTVAQQLYDLAASVGAVARRDDGHFDIFRGRVVVAGDAATWYGLYVHPPGARGKACTPADLASRPVPRWLPDHIDVFVSARCAIPPPAASVLEWLQGPYLAAAVPRFAEYTVEPYVADGFCNQGVTLRSGSADLLPIVVHIATRADNTSPVRWGPACNPHCAKGREHVFPEQHRFAASVLRSISVTASRSALLTFHQKRWDTLARCRGITGATSSIVALWLHGGGLHCFGLVPGARVGLAGLAVGTRVVWQRKHLEALERSVVRSLFAWYTRGRRLYLDGKGRVGAWHENGDPTLDGYPMWINTDGTNARQLALVIAPRLRRLVRDYDRLHVVRAVLAAGHDAAAGTAAVAHNATVTTGGPPPAKRGPAVDAKTRCSALCGMLRLSGLSRHRDGVAVRQTLRDAVLYL